MAATEPLVEYLAATRPGEKGQLTIPKQYREALGLKTGTPVAVLQVGDGLFLMPEQKRFERLCDSLASVLEGAGITKADLQSTLEESRRRVIARRYPRLSSASEARTTKTKGKRR